MDEMSWGWPGAPRKILGFGWTWTGFGASVGGYGHAKFVSPRFWGVWVLIKWAVGGYVHKIILKWVRFGQVRGKVYAVCPHVISSSKESNYPSNENVAFKLMFG